MSNAGSLLGNDYHEAFPHKITELNLGAVKHTRMERDETVTSIFHSTYQTLIHR